VRGGKKKYGGITDLDELRENLRVNCVPEISSARWTTDPLTVAKLTFL
jgi:hypothetical protein